MLKPLMYARLVWLVPIPLICTACAGGLTQPDTGLGAIDAVLGVSFDQSPGQPPAPSQDTNTGGTQNPPPSPQQSTSDARTVSGDLNAVSEFQLFDLGPSSAGDRWKVAPTLGGLSGPLVVVLFNARRDLLMRTYLYSGNTLRHVMRGATDNAILGVMMPSGGNSGPFSLKVTRFTQQTIPAPRRQTVWLNFAGGSNVRVNGRGGVTFGPFDGAAIGSPYAGQTDVMKQAILDAMRIDYAGYDIDFVSSDAAAVPSGAYSTLHFGGESSGLLGLADNVDDYNSELSQNAIVYTDSFAPYITMNLTPEEMAQMIANVASHEVGHLLGLYHTRDPRDLMDTTGTAWELAENQNFIRAPLEESVFATGSEDSPKLLRWSIGSKSGAAKLLAMPTLDRAILHELRGFTNDELRSGCGTCINLNQP